MVSFPPTALFFTSLKITTLYLTGKKYFAGLQSTPVSKRHRLLEGQRCRRSLYSSLVGWIMAERDLRQHLCRALTSLIGTELDHIAELEPALLARGPILDDPTLERLAAS